MHTRTILVFATFLLLISGTSKPHAEIYHPTKDSTVAIQPSQERIAVQADSTVTQIMSGTMFDRHPCLDPAVSPEDMKQCGPIERAPHVPGIGIRVTTFNHGKTKRQTETARRSIESTQAIPERLGGPRSRKEAPRM